MTDEEEPHTADGVGMLYDHFKHVTSLCLFSLAGGVALADKAHGRWAIMLVVALIMIGLAATISFAATGQIVTARLAGKTAIPNLHFSRTAPGVLLPMALGILVYIFVRSMPG